MDGGCITYVRPVPSVTALTRNVIASIAMSLWIETGTGNETGTQLRK